MPAVTPLLEAHRLTKRFGPVTAIEDVTFDLVAGEIHALCGENGAGKSTLIKTLAGVHPAGTYEGLIRVAGQPVEFHGVGDAERAGIAVIFQELALVEDLSIAENVFLGVEPRRGWWIDWERAHREAAELLARFNVSLDPSVPVRTLGVGQKQLVEIVKALRKRSRVLVLDEPTAALTETETERLLEIVSELRRQGVGIVYISHRLGEVKRIADRITVLRDGRTVSTLDAATGQIGDIIRQMVGREIREFFPRDRSRPLGERLLEVDGICVAETPTGRPRLDGITFHVRAGEVLGIGGLMGAGRTELLMHLMGAWGSRVQGRVRLRGEEFRARSPRDAIRRGLLLVSEDRKRYGLHLAESVGFNLSLSSLARFTRRGMVDGRAESEANRVIYDALRISAPGLDATVGGLSGGNQQKVVLGKVLMTRPSVVLLDEPTRGIDVGAKVEIYQLINRLTHDGHAVVLVSSEFPELMGMSDRILMLSEGQGAGEFQLPDFRQETLLGAAMGRHAGPTKGPQPPQPPPPRP